MNDIFGKICSIFLATIVLFGMPLVYMSERAKTAEQLWLLTQTTHFVDSVCNSGYISEQMMQQFYSAVSKPSAIYEISIIHEQPEYVYDEQSGAYVRCETFYDEEDIWARVEQSENYLFSRGDFLVLSVAKKTKRTWLAGITDQTVSVRYGGTIKYEAY
ncbi:MAG: hypothetical protein J6B28_01480 [Eubacterium sp.]|nr:hypothetical protein [Eubacterium sp.]